MRRIGFHSTGYRRTPLPAQLTAARDQAALRRSANRLRLDAISLSVCGTVAVNREGVWLGKGAGYSDIEVSLLIEAGLVTEKTTIVTTVHAFQVVDGHLPEAEHGFRVDVIVMPRK